MTGAVCCTVTPWCMQVMELDLSSLRSVRAFAAAWQGRHLPLNCLICNAGVFTMGAARELTLDGFEAHLGTNHLGHFLLTLLLLPSLRQASDQVGCLTSPSADDARRKLWAPLAAAQLGRSKLSLRLPCPSQTGRPGRVIHVSSKLHFVGSLHQADMNLAAGYSSLSAYAQSKLAQVCIGTWSAAASSLAQL